MEFINKPTGRKAFKCCAHVASGCRRSFVPLQNTSQHERSRTLPTVLWINSRIGPRTVLKEKMPIKTRILGRIRRHQQSGSLLGSVRIGPLCLWSLLLCSCILCCPLPRFKLMCFLFTPTTFITPVFPCQNLDNIFLVTKRTLKVFFFSF